jgi:hypothetical protein
VSFELDRWYGLPSAAVMPIMAVLVIWGAGARASAEGVTSCFPGAGAYIENQTMRPPTSEWILDNPAFGHLLFWLDHDEVESARKYEQIRDRLSGYFRYRGCTSPEELVGRVIDRVARRLVEGVQVHAADPYGYFRGVARNVYFESLREQRRGRDLTFLAGPDSSRAHRGLACMERCWALVPPQTRQMMIDYCSVDKSSKRRQRETLAEWLGLSLSTLRSARASRAAASGVFRVRVPDARGRH